MARAREAGMEERILDAAFKVFGEQGFQATTIKDIAAGASISSGSIYTYFEDKEALFRATVVQGWQSFIDELEKIDSGKLSQPDRVASLLHRGFAILGPALPLIKGMLFDASRLNLMEPYLDRACLAIDRLLKPDGEVPASLNWEGTRPRRLLVIRVLILGVLASAALVTQPSPLDSVERLREATLALLTQAGILKDGALSTGRAAGGAR